MTMSEVRWMKSCPSTNDILKKMAEKGAESFTAVAAREQTQGRGTHDRGWISPLDKGLYVSFLLHPGRPDCSLLPLTGGLACREAIHRSCQLSISLKWPNDLFRNGKKLGGILCESHFTGTDLNYVVMGIGINLTPLSTMERSGMEFEPVSLQESTGIRPDRQVLLKAVGSALRNWMSLFQSGREQEILKNYENALCFSRGDPLILYENGKRVQGIFRGIDSRGGLILEQPGDWKVLVSARIIEFPGEENHAAGD
jgi:BirA family transcriptional regulator, biotin operon repressor / biotin---[acetyl-CoA-carboxylase] ligase